MIELKRCHISGALIETSKTCQWITDGAADPKLHVCNQLVEEKTGIYCDLHQIIWEDMLKESEMEKPSGAV